MTSLLKLEATGFGWLIANGQRYDHDIIVTADAQIIARPKHLSTPPAALPLLRGGLGGVRSGGAQTSRSFAGSQTPRHFAGWHTPLGPEEIESALAGDPEILLVGRGQFSLLPILDETRARLAQRGVQIETASTPNALKRYEQLRSEGKRVAVILHVTC